MKLRFLQTGFIALALIVAVASACGGKVVFDGQPGQGGTGGSGGHGGAGQQTQTVVSSTVVVGVGPETATGVTGDQGASVGSGMMCGCQDFCAKLKMCGAPSNNCMGFCNQVPQSAKDCVCSTDCGNLASCFMGMTGSAGPSGTSGSGSGGGGLPQPCKDCVNNAANAQCSAQLDTCANNQDCVNIINCHQGCGYDQVCMMKCDTPFPNGEGDFVALIQCVACANCTMECSGVGIEDYCVKFTGP